MLLLSALLCPLTCRNGLTTSAQLNRVALLFQHGYFILCEKASEQLARHLQHSDPRASARFTVWQAEAAYWRGDYSGALSITSRELAVSNDIELTIRRHAIAASALVQLHRFADADQQIEQASRLCADSASTACGELLRTKGGLALERGQNDIAYDLYSKSLSLARASRQPLDEATALMNLAHASLLKEKPGDAIDLSNAAINLAQDLNARDILAMSTGNLGWAYYYLGDYERALKMSKDAEQQALAVDDDSAALLWLMTSARISQEQDDLQSAAKSYQQALSLATQRKSREEQLTALEELAHSELQAGNPDKADPYLKQAESIIQTNGNRLDALVIILARAKEAALHHNYPKAESLLRTVESDPNSQLTMRIGAQHELANLYEAQGRVDEAEHMYAVALTSFEASRAQITQENAKLPFLTKATSLYDDYIHFLVVQSKTDKALAIADQSRARTLAQGFDVDLNKPSATASPLNPQTIAQKADATLLFYWLGKTHSYLWAITPQKTSLFPLPAQKEITSQIVPYRKSIINSDDPLRSKNEAASGLYSTLIAPAANLINRSKPVFILADGELSQLNFETLVAPDPQPHFWIDDVVLEAAPSLSMLSAATPSRVADQRLLLLGDAISADENYPDLPNAAEEMRLISRHFSTAMVSSLGRQQATPDAYFASRPEHYAYIHFVAHGVASQVDPLESAIILSQPAAAQDPFKLYARQIKDHRIDAKLVTISACYGTGIKAYAGEGLVGLSWAFLRAGAHSTIGAMWQASDDSTPHLMDSVYQGLQKGDSPAVALRNAKLTLLHSHGIYQKPFYWAPFQIYTRL